MGLLSQQQKKTQKCQINHNAKEFLKDGKEEEEEEKTVEEHHQHILIQTNCTQSKSRRRRRRRKNIETGQAFKCLQNCLTAFCFLCLFVSTITPTTTTTKTTIITTNAVTATILSLTSVLLHVPFIAASSLQKQEEETENNKNYATYFARPWTESLINGELGVEVEVEPSLGVSLNDLERQGTSNEQQLLVFYERAKQKQQQKQKKILKYIENYEFDALVQKRAATKRSVATIATIISKPINATKSSKDTLSTAAHVTNQSTLTTTIAKKLESLSSVIADGELGVQDSTLLGEKCEPKVLNSVPMEPVSL